MEHSTASSMIIVKDPVTHDIRTRYYEA
jgi:hypothetical protein